MKHSPLGTLSAAILLLAAPAAMAAQHTDADGAMTDITCEEFLGLPASDQEMHATALTTARMDAAMPPAETDATGADGATEAAPDDPEPRSESSGTPTDGMTSNILSPTVVAIVTICENTVSGSGETDMTGTVSEGDGGETAD